MSTRHSLARRIAQGTCVATLAWMLIAAESAAVHAQAIVQAVGGVSVDANGVLSQATVEWMGRLSRLRTDAVGQVPGELNQKTPLRKVSLRALEAAIGQALKDGKELPGEIQYLAGLQRVQYVFVYPEQHDIVLAGPADGWRVDAEGNVVGSTTGQPVMLLEDLLVALRTARQAAQGGITCSIDPTAEGLARYASYRQQYGTTGNAEAFALGAKQAIGLKRITLTNVPPGSNFARVMVAADYRMKRLGMGLDAAPIRGLPSYLSMLRSEENVMPRWWLEPKYEPVLRSPDALAWELRGGTVKAMTEAAFLAENGSLQRGAAASATAQRWADNLTEKFDELAVAVPVFGQLRNCMELAIVGALMVKERLPERAGYHMPLLQDSAALATYEMPAPKQVDSTVSLVSHGRNTFVSVSGGVALNSWAIADKVEQGDAPGTARAQSTPKPGNWWWN